MNNLFPLSDKFLSFLDSNKQPVIYSLTFPSIRSSNIDELVLTGNLQGTLIDLMERSLAVHKTYSNYKFENYVSQWLIALTEAIKNSYYHDKTLDKNISTQVLVGDFGLGFGINDGGDFYKREDIALMIKNKEEPSKKKNSEFYNFKFKSGHGFSRCYDWVDFIDVNTSVGTLYMGFSKELILTKR